MIRTDQDKQAAGGRTVNNLCKLDGHLLAAAHGIDGSSSTGGGMATPGEALGGVFSSQR